MCVSIYIKQVQKKREGTGNAYNKSNANADVFRHNKGKNKKQDWWQPVPQFHGNFVVFFLQHKRFLNMGTIPKRNNITQTALISQSSRGFCCIYEIFLSIYVGCATNIENVFPAVSHRHTIIQTKYDIFYSQWKSLNNIITQLFNSKHLAFRYLCSLTRFRTIRNLDYV